MDDLIPPIEGQTGKKVFTGTVIPLQEQAGRPEIVVPAYPLLIDHRPVLGRFEDIERLASPACFDQEGTVVDIKAGPHYRTGEGLGEIRLRLPVFFSLQEDLGVIPDIKTVPEMLGLLFQEGLLVLPEIGVEGIGQKGEEKGDQGYYRPLDDQSFVFPRELQEGSQGEGEVRKGKIEPAHGDERNGILADKVEYRHQTDKKRDDAEKKEAFFSLDEEKKRQNYQKQKGKKHFRCRDGGGVAHVEAVQLVRKENDLEIVEDEIGNEKQAFEKIRGDLPI
ncbi:MAG TPA: hypothetical protein PLN44_10555 [Syntrophales bacterium]|nr:hypothetical protein [Syntrophales bacterium]